MYDYDANIILAAPMKNRKAKTITDTWQGLHDQLTQHGHETKHFILDNERYSNIHESIRSRKGCLYG